MRCSNAKDNISNLFKQGTKMVLRIKSVFKDALLKYRAIQLASGIKNVSIERQLNYFDDFIIENEISEIIFTKEMASKWDAYRIRINIFKISGYFFVCIYVRLLF